MTTSPVVSATGLFLRPAKAGLETSYLVRVRQLKKAPAFETSYLSARAYASVGGSSSAKRAWAATFLISESDGSDVARRSYRRRHAWSVPNPRSKFQVSSNTSGIHLEFQFFYTVPI